MKESNELNDIILNKGGGANNNKKIILAVATLGIILIIVVVLMNSLTSSGTDNLPQAVLPPEPKTQQTIQEEPLFEEVEVVQEKNQDIDNLDRIAKKLKAESQIQKSPVVVAPVIKKPVVKKQVVVKHKAVVKPKVKQSQKPKTTTLKTSSSGSYYIQVGSFSKYKPNKKFLKSVTDLGYAYKFHQVTNNSKTLNKVLVGPFNTSNEAKDARRVLRAKVEPGAFLTKIK